MKLFLYHGNDMVYRRVKVCSDNTALYRLREAPYQVMRLAADARSIININPKPRKSTRYVDPAVQMQRNAAK